jgi:hypothetical protein
MSRKSKDKPKGKPRRNMTCSQGCVALVGIAICFVLVPVFLPATGSSSPSSSSIPHIAVGQVSRTPLASVDSTQFVGLLNAINTDLAADTALPQISDISLDSGLLTVSYLTEAKTPQQINNEWMRFVDDIVTSMISHDMTLDQIALDSSTNDSTNGGSTLTVLYKNVLAYHAGEMTRAQFLNNVQYSAHNPTDIPPTKDRTATAESRDATRQARNDNLTATAYSKPPTSVPYVAPPMSNATTCPSNCTECVAMGWNEQQCGKCPKLDRDHDGLACYQDK